MFAEAPCKDYGEWVKCHIIFCERNHSGASGAIEMAAVKDMFKRSVELHRVRYTEHLVDGDGKSIEAVNDDKPYGLDVTVHKLEISTI